MGQLALLLASGADTSIAYRSLEEKEGGGGGGGAQNAGVFQGVTAYAVGPLETTQWLT